MEIIVVDASVIVKWYIIEEDREKSLKIREDYIGGRFKLAAPAILPFEVLNAIRFSRRDLASSTLKSIAESLTLYGIELYQLTGKYRELTIDASYQNKISIYDASYVALAKLLNTILYTADQRLINSLTNDYKKYVKHIREYD